MKFVTQPILFLLLLCSRASTSSDNKTLRKANSLSIRSYFAQFSAGITAFNDLTSTKLILNTVTLCRLSVINYTCWKCPGYILIPESLWGQYPEGPQTFCLPLLSIATKKGVLLKGLLNLNKACNYQARLNSAHCKRQKAKVAIQIQSIPKVL